MILDMQFGSTGKGLFAGWLASQRYPEGEGWYGGRNIYTGVVTANMPNAGHTYTAPDGEVFMFKTLPIGAVVPGVRQAFVGPGAVYDPTLMLYEYERAKKRNPSLELLIHPMSVPVTDEHRNLEASALSKISSTMQGSMTATMDKMMRQPGERTVARDRLTGERLGDYVVTVEDWVNALLSHDNIIAEGSQGYSLGLDTEFYPYVTSRNCTPMAFWSAMGLPMAGMKLAEVIGTLRTYPIRVGNTKDGYSGGGYDDQRETSWESIGQEPEYTTVTKRQRRVFTFSHKQLRDAYRWINPSSLFLNFCNYMKTEDELNDLIKSIEKEIYTPVRWMGFGPNHNDISVRETING
jgi:adenylosuccinate synthase